MTDKIIKTSIRLPSSMLKKLQMEAILEETSMQQIILRLIEGHLYPVTRERVYKTKEEMLGNYPE